MRTVLNGFAILIIIAIIIIVFWCFFLGKCGDRTFGVLPPRPRLNVSGRGRSNAGAQGKGSTGVTPSGGGENKDCSFWDLGCKVGRFFKEGTTFFGQKPIIPEQLRTYVNPSVLRGGR